MSIDNEQLAADVADIRIDPALAEELIRSVVAEMDDERISARIDEERDFQMAAIRTSQDVLTMTTLAQTMSATVPFKNLLTTRAFAAGDADLQTIGQALAEKIAKQARIPDSEIPDDLLAARYKAIIAAI